MPEEKKIRSASRHAIHIDRRESVVSSGVVDVISFDEETIIAETELGILIIRGHNLHVKRVNLENGDLAVEGEIVGINYEEANGHSQGKSLFSKLFR